MKRMRILALVVLLLAVCASASAEGNWLESVLGGVQADQPKAAQSGEAYIAWLEIDGELAEDDYTYDHAGTLDAIDELISDERNAALLIVLNTPGGGIYEADELYHELMCYKQETGRPIYAYMKQECCSGGVLVAMAADVIMASRMTLTGNVGVYLSSYSEAGLYEKLGIEREYITTGENKVSGYPTLTDEQRAIEQALVDESFMFFKEAIAQSRSLSETQMEAFTDGRILSALQAKELGLIDEVLYYDEAVAKVLALHGGGDTELRDVTPMWSYPSGIPSGSFLDWLKMLPEGGEDTTKNTLRLPRGRGGIMAR